MKKRLCISFPVFEPDPWLRDKGVSGRLIGLRMSPIPQVDITKKPINCDVLGIDEKGQKWQWTMPLGRWQDAVESPVYFLEAPSPDQKGPRADVTSQALKSTAVLNRKN